MHCLLEPGRRPLGYNPVQRCVMRALKLLLKSIALRILHERNSGVEKLANTVLRRALEMSADRISFGTPLEHTVPRPFSAPALAVWLRIDRRWSFFDYMPAVLIPALQQNLTERTAGLPLVWDSEGHPLQFLDDMGKTHNLRIRLGFESEGAFFVELLPSVP
jgi:hypothetical protein